MNSPSIIEKPTTVEQEKLVQSQFNTNVAFFIHVPRPWAARSAAIFFEIYTVARSLFQTQALVRL